MTAKKIVLRFSKDNTYKPLIYRLVKDYDLVFNIIKANVNPDSEGTVVLELTGDKYEEGLQFLNEQGVIVQQFAEQLARNTETCTSCGACTAHCPTGALYIERPSMEVEFVDDKCVLCMICVKVCPVKAMEVKF